jgi:hypothetical protein
VTRRTSWRSRRAVAPRLAERPLKPRPSGARHNRTPQVVDEVGRACREARTVPIASKSVKRFLAEPRLPSPTQGRAKSASLNQHGETTIACAKDFAGGKKSHPLVLIKGVQLPRLCPPVTAPLGGSQLDDLPFAESGHRRIVPALGARRKPSSRLLSWREHGCAQHFATDAEDPRAARQRSTRQSRTPQRSNRGASGIVDQIEGPPRKAATKPQ